MNNNFTLCELWAIAKRRKIKGYTKYRKSELAELLGINVSEGNGKQTEGETLTPPKILPLREVTGTSTSKPEKQHEMKQTRNWLDLPSDLMVNILSRVGAIEILWNVQIVCPEWHKICKDPRVWRVIYIHSYFYSGHRPYTWPSCLPSSGSSWEATVEVCKQAVDRSEGQLVYISMVELCDDELLQYVADRSSELRGLEIAYTYNGRLALATALKKLKKLEELSLFNGTILQKDIEALGCYCPMLKTLKLNDCDNPDLTDYELAMAIVENLPQLRHLELTWHFLCDSMLRTILDGCRYLQVLDLRMCGPFVLEGELKQRCLEQIRSLKLPTDPLKTDPYSENDTIVDLESYNIWG
nr:putative F-box/LRR-repeat protein 23 [Tanacetum cinerariifolium]